MACAGWSPSCAAGDDDYEVYEGLIGDFTSHAALLCTTGGATSTTITPTAGSRYYLVVPTNGTREGSYGVNSGDVQRPQGAAVCQEQEVVVCP